MQLSGSPVVPHSPGASAPERFDVLAIVSMLEHSDDGGMVAVHVKEPKEQLAKPNSPSSHQTFLLKKEHPVRTVVLKIARVDPPLSIKQCKSVYISNIVLMDKDGTSVQCDQEVGLLDLPVQSVSENQVVALWECEKHNCPVFSDTTAPGSRIFVTIIFDLQLDKISKPVRLSKDLCLKVHQPSPSTDKLIENMRSSLTSSSAGPDEEGVAFYISLTKSREVDQQNYIYAIIEEHQKTFEKLGNALQVEKRRQELDFLKRFSPSRPRTPDIGDDDDLLPKDPNSSFEKRKSLVSRGRASTIVKVKVQELKHNSFLKNSAVSGYLNYRKSVEKPWVKLWFILKKPFLYCFAKNTDTEFKKKLELVSFVASPLQDADTPPNTFVVVVKSRAWMLQAASAEERDKWLSALNSSAQLGKQPETIEELKNELKATQELLEGKNEEVQQSKHDQLLMEEYIDNLKSQLLVLGEKLQEEEKNFTALQLKLQHTDHRVVQLETQLEASENTRKATVETVVSINAQLQTITTEKQALLDEKNRLRDEFAAATTRCEELESKVGTLEALVQTLQTDSSTKSDQIGQLQNQIASQMADLQIKNQEIADLNKRFEAHSEETGAKIRQLEDRLTQQLGELEAKSTMVDKLTAIIKEHQDTAVNKAESSALKVAQLEEFIERQNIELQQEKQHKETALHNLQDSSNVLSELRTKVQELETALSHHSGSSQQLEEANLKSAQLQTTIEQLQSDFAGRAKQLEEQVSVQSKELQLKAEEVERLSKLLEVGAQGVATKGRETEDKLTVQAQELGYKSAEVERLNKIVEAQAQQLAQQEEERNQKIKLLEEQLANYKSTAAETAPHTATQQEQNHEAVTTSEDQLAKSKEMDLFVTVLELANSKAAAAQAELEAKTQQNEWLMSELQQANEKFRLQTEAYQTSAEKTDKLNNELLAVDTVKRELTATKRQLAEQTEKHDREITAFKQKLERTKNKYKQDPDYSNLKDRIRRTDENRVELEYQVGVMTDQLRSAQDEVRLWKNKVQLMEQSLESAKHDAQVADEFIEQRMRAVEGKMKRSLSNYGGFGQGPQQPQPTGPLPNLPPKDLIPHLQRMLEKSEEACSMHQSHNAMLNNELLRIQREMETQVTIKNETIQRMSKHLEALRLQNKKLLAKLARGESMENGEVAEAEALADATQHSAAAPTPTKVENPLSPSTPENGSEESAYQDALQARRMSVTSRRMSMFSSGQSPKKVVDPTKCGKCTKEFGFFRRKYPCVNCKADYCSSCSTDQVVKMPGAASTVEARLCDDCVTFLSKQQATKPRVERLPSGILAL